MAGGQTSGEPGEEAPLLHQPGVTGKHCVYLKDVPEKWMMELPSDNY